MALTITTPDVTQLHPAYCGSGGCACFEDDTYLDVGSPFSITLSLSSNPVNGDNFIFGGQTWTYRTLPSLDWEILIGVSTNATATNTAAAFYTLADVDNVTYAATAITNSVVVASVPNDPSLGLAFTAGTAPMTASSPTAAIAPAVASPYVLLARVRTRSTDDLSDYDSSEDIVVTPFVQASSLNGDLTAEMCVPLQSLVAPKLSTPFPDNSQTTPEVLHTPIAETQVRYSLNGGAWATSSAFHFFPGRCAPDTEQGLEPYSPNFGGGRGVSWLNHVTDETFCVGSFPPLYAAIDSVAYTMTVTYTDSGSPDTYNITAPYKWAVLHVNVGGLLPSGYSGPVLIELAMTGAPNTAHADVQMSFMGDCDCSNQIIFLNDFGVYEMIPTGQKSNEAVEVSADVFTGCADCLTTGGSTKELRNTFAESFTVYTRKETMDDDRKARLISLLTSPEVWLQRLEGNTVKSYRVTLQRGGTVWKEGLTDYVQVGLDVLLPTKQTNSN